MSFDPLTAPPPAPQRNDPTFSDKADDFVSWMALTFQPELDAFITELNSLGYPAWPVEQITGVLAVEHGGTGGSTKLAAQQALDLEVGVDVQEQSDVLDDLDQGIVSTGLVGAAVDDGTQSSGTYTPSPSTGNWRRIVNGGAFTLAAPTLAGDYSMMIHITNNASAGTITMSGFDGDVDGDVFATTDGKKYILSINKLNGDVIASVKATNP